MGLFSKEECDFCGEKAGMLGRKKLKDGEYICKDCEKKCSIYFEPGKFDKAEVDQHMEYMKKQDALYNTQYATLPDDAKWAFKQLFGGIVFADSIAMFEVIDPETKKRECKELFRYDQIANYERYAEENNSGEGDKYSEVGVEITMRCSQGMSGVGMSDIETARAHPYLESVRILCAKDEDNMYSSTKGLMDKLNAIFLRESDDKSMAESLKDGLFGSKKEQRDIAQGADLLKSFGKFAKAKMEGSDAGIDDLKESLASTANNAFGNQAVHKELADAAEQRAWG